MGPDLTNYSIVSLKVGHIKTKALVDCGAVPNVIHTPLYEEIKARGGACEDYNLQYTTTRLRGVTVGAVPAAGIVQLPCKFGKEQLRIEFLVADSEKPRFP